MSSLKIFPGVLGLVMMFGCLTDPGEFQIDGTYTYVGKKADGSIESTGSFSIWSTSDSTFFGSWVLENVQGDGKLVGWRKDGEVGMDLHPGWRDHNLLLKGTFKVRAISGTWQWVGFGGPMSEGTFEAKRKQ